MPSDFARGSDAKLGGGMKTEVPNFSPAGRAPGEDSLYRNATVEKKANGVRPPPKTGCLTLPARLRSLFLMVMRGDARAGSGPGWVTAAPSPRPPAAPPRRSPSRPPTVDPAPGRGERLSAEQTKPAAAMRGRPGSARAGGRDGAPGCRVGPPGARRGPLVPTRQAGPPPPHPPPSLGELRGTDWEVS